ncbi:MAG: hypothetical protein Fur0028_00190 [Bacteroidales bacterium]
MMKTVTFVFLIIAKLSIFAQNKNDMILLSTNNQGKGQKIQINFTKGKQFNHPLLAIWLTTTDGKYIQTLYVSQSIAKGIYEHGKSEQGKWFPGEHRRPAALPYWAFSRNIKEEDGLYIPTPKTPIADAYTGATPQNNFVLETQLDETRHGKAILWFEINQPFDFNDFWHNQKYANNNAYRTSGQPSVVYMAIIDFDREPKEYFLHPMGHGSPTGENGELNTDLYSLTTALKIAEKIVVKIN